MGSKSSTRNHAPLLLTACVVLGGASGCRAAERLPVVPREAPWVVVLGIAQDGGAPQAGDPSAAGWGVPERRALVTALGLVDPLSGERWLLEATPDLPEQLRRLDALAPTDSRPGLTGIFVTHAHFGHYAGLGFLGHEVMGARAVPLWVMPRMAEYLRTNGPWSQLVRYGNVELRELAAGSPVRLNGRLSVTPLLVPHRQEFSEVIALRIDGPEKSVLFLPDIDSWEKWDEQGTRIEDVLAGVDRAFLDGTFWANGEIPGRDMTGFPHPFLAHSLERFGTLPPEERAKVRFVHLNHTNPALWEGAERATLRAAGLEVAREGELYSL